MIRHQSGLVPQGIDQPDQIRRRGDEAKQALPTQAAQQSGNSKGRPKGSRNRKTIVKAVAHEMHGVTENGKRRRLSTIELVLLRLRNLALEGKNVRAFDAYHGLIKAYQPQASNDDVGYLVVPAPMSNEEWKADQEEKNKHRKRPF